MAALLKSTSHAIDNSSNAALAAFGHRRCDQNLHLRGVLLSRDHKIVVRKRAQQTPNCAIRFQTGKLNRVSTGNKRELMNSSVRTNNFPARPRYELAYLREKETYVKWLRGL